MLRACRRPARTIALLISLRFAAGWLILVLPYAVQGSRRMLTDLGDPVLNPIPSLAAITSMMLGAMRSTVVFTPGRISGDDLPCNYHRGRRVADRPVEHRRPEDERGPDPGGLLRKLACTKRG